jgi:hypothetical protein
MRTSGFYAESRRAYRDPSAQTGKKQRGVRRVLVGIPRMAYGAGLSRRVRPDLFPRCFC